MHSKNFLTFKQNIWQTLQDIGVGKNYNIGVLTRTPNTKTNPKNQQMKLYEIKKPLHSKTNNGQTKETPI